MYNDKNNVEDTHKVVGPIRGWRADPPPRPLSKKTYTLR